MSQSSGGDGLTMESQAREWARDTVIRRVQRELHADAAPLDYFLLSPHRREIRRRRFFPCAKNSVLASFPGAHWDKDS